MLSADEVVGRDEYGRLLQGAKINRHKTIILAAALSATGVLAYPPGADAQTIQSYRCSDGTRFIVGFYEADSRAFLQIDGRAVTLGRRLALSGSRYSGGGVTLKIGRSGTTIKHAKRPVTACELEQRT